MRLLVLAASFNDFKKWCWEHQIPVLHATYVSSPERLAGRIIRPEQVVRVTGHERHPDAAAIKDAVDHALAKGAAL